MCIPLLRAVAGLALAVAITACGPTQRWRASPDGAPAAPPKPGQPRIVLFAPTALGPLASTYPDARLAYAHDLATRVALLVRDQDARVGDELPSSDDPAWNARVAATAGAHVVVLSEVLEIARTGGVAGRSGASGPPPQARAIARLRALDPQGREVWTKTASAIVPVPTSPKLLSAAAAPESRASWEALSAANGALMTWLQNLPDAVAATPAIDPAALVEVAIDSRPSNADILVDGELRGTTPRTLKLPRRPVTLRLERQGHRPWERTVTASDGLALTPALEPLAPRDEAPPRDAPPPPDAATPRDEAPPRP